MVKAPPSLSLSLWLWLAFSLYFSSSLLSLTLPFIPYLWFLYLKFVVIFIVSKCPSNLLQKQELPLITNFLISAKAIGNLPLICLACIASALIKFKQASSEK